MVQSSTLPTQGRNVHLYQHYFLNYADLHNDIAALRNRAGRWIYLYRIDEYIGTQIGQLNDQTIKNGRLGAGSRMDYWSTGGSGTMRTIRNRSHA